MTFDIQNDDELLVLAEKLQSRPDIAALLKEASVDAEYSDLVDSAFADQKNRMYPIYSPEQALISAAYLDGEDNELAKEACENALISWNHDTIKISSLTKVASTQDTIPDEMFLLSKQRKLPVVDAETLEKSAQYLGSNWSKLDEAQKLEASHNLYKVATEQYEMNPESLSFEVLSYAQKVPCDLHKLAMQVSERYAESQHEGYRPFMDKIASLKDSINGSISFDESLNTGIAYELLSLDKEASMAHLFNAIPDTFNSMYIEGELAKTASSAIVIGGIEVSQSQIDAVDSASVKLFLGEDLHKEASVDDEISGNSLIDFANDAMPDLAEEIGLYVSSL